VQFRPVRSPFYAGVSGCREDRAHAVDACQALEEEPSEGTTQCHDLSRPLAGLLDYAERTQEPLARIVSKALAEYLQVSHHTLYQVSPPPPSSTGSTRALYESEHRESTAIFG
jgi:hypothetical protein